MFENFTYKQKLIGLAILTVLMFLTANKRSFRITKQAYQQAKGLKEKLQYVNATGASVTDLQNELALYDKVIGVQGVTPEEVQQHVLDFASSFPNVSVFGMEEIHMAESNGFTIMTNQLILEGDYNSLIDVIYAFEKRFEFSNVVSIAFVKEKDYQAKKNIVRVKVIFQNYEKIS